MYLRVDFAMVFLSAFIWVTVSVLLAWGIQWIWTGMTKPKAFNTVLFPGTVIASIGRTVALLITGATWSDAPKGEAGRTRLEPCTSGPQPKMPLMGPIIAAVIPLLLVGAVLYLLILQLGAPILGQLSQIQVAKDLPWSLSGFWEQLRSLVTLSEKTLDAVWHTPLTGSVKDVQPTDSWQSLLFVYLMICLTIRLAPFPGNVRGHLIAVAALGAGAALAGTVTPRLEQLLTAGWPLLSFTVGWLLLLMIVSLLAKAVVTSARSVIKWD